MSTPAEGSAASDQQRIPPPEAPSAGVSDRSVAGEVSAPLWHTPVAKFTLSEVKSAWQDGNWSWAIGGHGSGYWHEQPRWYRAITWLSWMLRHFVERPRAAWQIITADGPHRDVGHGPAAWLRVARGVLCAFTGRINHSYPGYPDHPMSWELASWDHHTWAGNEYTCWRARFAAVCTGKAWHLHVYEDGE